MSSVRKFDAPLERQRTASLDALKAYSEGTYLYDHGHRTESIPHFQQAIALDPDFAAPYVSLSAIYYALDDDKLAATNMERAYALRNTVNERERLLIVSRYQIAVTKDLDAAIRALRDWSEVYPADVTAWNNLAVIEDSIGRHGQAVEDAEQALALAPTMEAPYMTLAQAYLRSGHADEASRIAALAVAKGLAGDATHGLLLRIAFARRDGDGVAREIAWAHANQGEDTALAQEAEMALGRGQVAAAGALFDRAIELDRQLGAGDTLGAAQARFLADLGLIDQARARLSRAEVDADGDYLFALAEVGDPARAESMLAQTIRQRPHDTLLGAVVAPQVRAALALRRKTPLDAVAALRPALAYEARDFETPYVLGSAWLAAGDGLHAAAAFRTILDHPGWDPVSPLYVRARLGLARAERLEGDLPAARRDYQAFVDAWKDADPDVPILQAAKAESARLAPPQG
jgi:tetratricopeptide (TPR) repeat protein